MSEDKVIKRETEEKIINKTGKLDSKQKLNQDLVKNCSTSSSVICNTK